MVGTILGNCRICSVTCLLKSLFFHLFCFRSVWLYFLKLVVNETDTKPQVKQDKSETYNYIQSNLPAACVNNCSKVKVHELGRSLKFICLNMDFSGHSDQQITNLLFDA